MQPFFKIELRLPVPEFREPMIFPDPIDEIHRILSEMLVRLRTQEPHWGGYYHGHLKDKAKNHIGYYTLSLVLED